MLLQLLAALLLHLEPAAEHQLSRQHGAIERTHGYSGLHLRGGAPQLGRRVREGLCAFLAPSLHDGRLSLDLRSRLSLRLRGRRHARLNGRRHAHLRGRHGLRHRRRRGCRRNRRRNRR